MTATRVIDDHIALANIGTKTHAEIEGHIQGIGDYAFPAADGAVNQILETDGAGVLSFVNKPAGFACGSLNACNLTDIGTRAHASLTGIGTSDHHVKYTDAEVIAAIEGETIKPLKIQLPTNGQIEGYTNGAYVNLVRYKGNKNFCSGLNAGNSITTGNNNFLIGGNVGMDITTGYDNVGIGNTSLENLISGYVNMCIGQQTGRMLTTGWGNTFIGNAAGRSGTNGQKNVYLGYFAGADITGGENNIMIGTDSGLYAHQSTKNCFIGYRVGHDFDSVDTRNTFIGYYAAKQKTGGGYNTYMGPYVGRNSGNGAYCVFIGNYAGRYVTDSYRLYIASSAADADTLIHGEFDNKYLFFKGATSAPADAKLHNSDINFWMDETNNQLEIKIKKSDGTVKTGNVQLA